MMCHNQPLKWTGRTVLVFEARAGVGTPFNVGPLCDQMDDNLAKSKIQAVLVRAGGQVGTFVDLRDLAAHSLFGNAEADATIAELLARRWMYRKGDYVSVSKSAMEYAID